MTLSYLAATEDDQHQLAELRVAAMKPSLMKVGRFDETRARNRFLQGYEAEITTLVKSDDQLVGFYSLHQKPDHLWLDHLYFHPDQQGKGHGRKVMERILALADQAQLPVRLGALIESPANDFYQYFGFVETHREEFDIYYQYDS